MQYFAFTWPMFIYYICVVNNTQNTARTCFAVSNNESLISSRQVLSNFKINNAPDYNSENQAKTVVLKFNAVSLQDISRSVSRKFANISAQEVTKIYFTEVLTKYSDFVPAEQYLNFVVHKNDAIQLTNLTTQNHLKLQAKKIKLTNNTVVRQHRNRKLFANLQYFLQSVRRMAKLILIKLMKLKNNKRN